MRVSLSPDSMGLSINFFADHAYMTAVREALDLHKTKILAAFTCLSEKPYRGVLGDILTKLASVVFIFEPVQHHSLLALLHCDEVFAWRPIRVGSIDSPPLRAVRAHLVRARELVMLTCCFEIRENLPGHRALLVVLMTFLKAWCQIERTPHTQVILRNTTHKLPRQKFLELLQLEASDSSVEPAVLGFLLHYTHSNQFSCGIRGRL